MIRSTPMIAGERFHAAAKAEQGNFIYVPERQVFLCEWRVVLRNA
jgi:hypothetical protein